MSLFTLGFQKDAWIKDAIRSRYLIPRKDGTILRANRADKDGVIDLAKGYSLVKYQIHKPSGRVYFNMRWKGINKSVLVNRVIALAFLPNPLNLPQVNHIDGNKENNRLVNEDGTLQLEWSTGADNEKHAHRTGLKTGRGGSNSNAKLSAPQVLDIRARGAAQEQPESIATLYGVSRSTIMSILSRKTWTHL